MFGTVENPIHPLSWNIFHYNTVVKSYGGPNVGQFLTSFPLYICGLSSKG